MPPTELTTQLAAQIADHIRVGNAPKGTRLVERVLAENLRVSRSPVRSALRLLAEEGVVGTNDRGGFVVAQGGEALAARPQPPTGDDEAYLAIAEDRLKDALPEKVTENALARRYSLTKGQLARVLRRGVSEGWIERLPGHGWAFLPVLTSMQAYEDSYRFRLVIEPAAILEPGFALNRPALEECRARQQRLVDGEIWAVSNATLFEVNSRLHQAIIACSGNGFFVESLKRIDTLRRLMEYRQSLDRKYAVVRCQEHLQLVDMLLAGERQKASEFLRRHLSSVGREKTVVRTSAAGQA